jgi:hypothetical protein
MDETCCCPPEAGSSLAERSPRKVSVCPDCSEAGRPVQGQTVKALLAVSLRAVGDADYLFCRTPTCAVVYFAIDGSHVFTTEQVRERVYQKVPDQAGVFICYCFRHTVGDVRGATTEGQAALIADINAGIQAGQCACDLRNPQGSCCLGNVRTLIKQVAAENKVLT